MKIDDNPDMLAMSFMKILHFSCSLTSTKIKVGLFSPLWVFHFFLLFFLDWSCEGWTKGLLITSPSSPPPPRTWCGQEVHCCPLPLPFCFQARLSHASSYLRFVYCWILHFVEKENKHIRCTWHCSPFYQGRGQKKEKKRKKHKSQQVAGGEHGREKPLLRRTTFTVSLKRIKMDFLFLTISGLNTIWGQSIAAFQEM